MVVLKKKANVGVSAVLIILTAIAKLVYVLVCYFLAWYPDFMG